MACQLRVISAHLASRGPLLGFYNCNSQPRVRSTSWLRCQRFSSSATVGGQESSPKLNLWDTRTQSLQPFNPKPHVQQGSRLDSEPESFLGPWMADLPVVSWYMCGPTVYDHSHVGHARTYVSFDIIRRIMTELGGYNLVVAMGITDVDDKIIARANETKRLYNEVAKEFELSFMDDMHQLNVLPPNTYLRVSDRVKTISDYIEVLLERGYAYEPEGSKGSIYFDTQEFQKSGMHEYGKLARSLHDISADQVAQDRIDTSFKKHPADFVLWKASKPNEPSWESPWGSGRPGWHIECSVAASQTFGSQLTIHSGGIDLQFPHHNNEIAQSEAYFDQPEWTQYWMHSGHLHIQGRKMSKSLKNFVTIKEFLAEHSPNTFRMFCLTAGYRSNVDFADDRIEEARHILASIAEFVNTVMLRGQLARTQNVWSPGDAAWTEVETLLQQRLVETEVSMERACLDDFSTAEAINELRVLISEANSYMTNNPTLCLNRGQQLLEAVSDLASRYFRIFGFPESALSPAGTNDSDPSALNRLSEGWIDFRGRIRQIAVSSLKAQKKHQKALAKGEDDDLTDVDLANQLAQDILKECDAVRDQEMPKFGISLQDFSGGLSKWSREDRSSTNYPPSQP